MRQGRFSHGDGTRKDQPTLANQQANEQRTRDQVSQEGKRRNREQAQRGRKEGGKGRKMEGSEFVRSNSHRSETYDGNYNNWWEIVVNVHKAQS